MTSSTISTIAAFAQHSGLGALAAMALIVLLATRELATAAGHRLEPLRQNLTVAIAPLSVVFAAVVIRRLIELF